MDRAFLTFGVLEDGMRRMAIAHGWPAKDTAEKGLFKPPMRSRIQSSASIRNSAAHGRFNEYGPQDVGDMLKGVRDFLDENLR